jgi:hypothetical protein
LQVTGDYSYKTYGKVNFVLEYGQRYDLDNPYHGPCTITP